MSAAVRWGILGPGAIARSFATAVDALEGHEVVATGSRDPERALLFNAERNYGAEVGTYEQVASSESVDVVYVATPHPGHLEHAALALRHGKAVLCEKPLTVNASEARALCALAREQDVLLMEAMWSRFLPATRRVEGWLASGAIGEPRKLAASFGFEAGFDSSSRLYAPELAGGSLLDVGCYTLSLAALVFGQALIDPAAVGGEGPKIEVEAELAPTGVDRHCSIVLGFPSGAEAHLECSISRQTDHRASIQGTEGRIVIDDFWRARRAVLYRDSRRAATSEFPFLANGYEYQALEVERLLREGATESPLLPHAESIAVVELMDEIRRRIDVQYPFESAIGVTRATHSPRLHRPSARPPGTAA